MKIAMLILTEIGRMYTNNETALLTLISNINNQFYYIGEDDDKVAPVDVKKFTQYCVDFIDSLEIEKWTETTWQICYLTSMMLLKH